MTSRLEFLLIAGLDGALRDSSQEATLMVLAARESKMTLRLRDLVEKIGGSVSPSELYFCWISVDGS